MYPMTIKRIKELRKELKAERISYGELHEIDFAADEAGVEINEEMMAGEILEELENAVNRLKRQPWTYKGVNVHPADRNGSGIRWYARIGKGYTLRADTKESMRQLISRELD